jgi:3',5'-cyclic AMP phosphodiesterase CpdA
MRLDDSNPPIDFFISYSPADERWATWIAWQLETAGHRTLLQAWSFVPGTDFIDFMDRGVRDSAVVVAVLSRNYLKSHYGRMEWQAALRTDRTKLITIRIEDCPLEGLLATITYLDLVEVTDPDVARERLLTQLRYALAGRAKPAREPVFPAHPATLIEAPHRDGDGTLRHQPGASHAPEPAHSPEPPRIRRPQTPPSYPPASPTLQARREAIALLHVPGPRFGRGMAEHLDARDLQSRIWAHVTQLTDAGAPAPDLILVTGDLMESGRPGEWNDALTFLTGLRVLLGLEPDRLIIVPGGHDVSRVACHSYFLLCESRDIQPQQPYFPKLEHYAQLFDELYQGLEGPLFDTAQPWTLFAVPELRVAIAGLNSTMAITHRPEDDYGWIGEEQAAWFATQLRTFEDLGWLRVGIIRHDPELGGSAGSDPTLLRDAATLDRLLGSRLNVLLNGPGPGGTSIGFLSSGLTVVPATGPGQEEIIQVTAEGWRRFSVYGDGKKPALFRHEWHAIGGTFPTTTAEKLEAGNGAPALERRLAPAPTADPQSLLLDRIEEVC